jgi:hypothetical protein
LQTTDNYVDWTSLTVLHLTDIRWSNRTIPIGIDSEIDIATMSFETPIFITPPAKVKKLGVITSVIANMWDEERGTIDLSQSMPEMTAYTEELPPIEEVVKNDSERSTVTRIDTDLGQRSTVATSYRNYGVYIRGNNAQLIERDNIGTVQWLKPIESYPGTYIADVSEIRLRTETGFIVGTFTINPFNDFELSINWDTDTLPTGDVVSGPARDTNSYTSFDKIVDPLTYNPTNDKVAGFRILVLSAINDSSSINNAGYDGPDAWKNNNGTDFVANANDVIEWDGASWNTVIDSTDSTNGINQKNLTTGIVYKWNGEDWLQAFEGEYPVGTWELYLDP